MSDAIQGLKPELVWKYFSEIARIPRPSKHEEKIARYVLETAKKLGLQTRQDRAGNILVKKPASAGREGTAGIILQGHLDMVCEKNAGKQHDFMKDPIELVRKGNMLMANGTTLGADNGIAVATNLAIMEDKSIVHGPLEFLFTIDEETGLTGASNLGPDLLGFRTMMNLDSEEEGALYVGCSGGRDTLGTWNLGFKTAPEKSVPVQISITGLKGGHSGLEIDKGRGNAIKILNRVLLALTGIDGRVSRMEGGNKRNAIPREAGAVVFIRKKEFPEATTIVGQLNTTIRAELASVDPDLQISIAGAKDVGKGGVLRRTDQEMILKTISGLPHGVVKMSADISGLVETSTNVAVLTTTKKTITLGTSQRSSVASEIDELCHTVGSIFELGGADVGQSDGYPGWKPNLESQILKLAKQTYKELAGREPAVKAIHAGLECGIIGEKYPGIDMVSFGPTLEGVHSPDEKIHIDTVEKFWNFLLAILRNVK